MHSLVIISETRPKTVRQVAKVKPERKSVEGESNGIIAQTQPLLASLQHSQAVDIQPRTEQLTTFTTGVGRMTGLPPPPPPPTSQVIKNINIL